MASQRFLVASSVARLIQGALGSEWRVEGYLNGGDQRKTHVLLAGSDGHLILEEEVEGTWEVDDIIVPRRHAEALLDTCLGRLDIDRVTLALNGRPAVLDRISSRDKKVDLLTVETQDAASQGKFYPPAWVGREANDDLYNPRTLASAGIPAVAETSVSNSGLEALLDSLEQGAMHRPAAEGLPQARVPSGLKAAQDSRPAPRLPDPDRGLASGRDRTASNAPSTRPISEVLSGVLNSSDDVLPPEQSTIVNPDHWGQRRKQ